MADEDTTGEETCISVEFGDGSQWDYCWSDGHPDPSWQPENVTTGLRHSQSDTARSWRTCQYYLKGLSSICSWWKEGSPDDEEGTTTSGSFFCSFVQENTSDNPQDPPPEIPTGFNYNQCDFLGRRQWCSKYEESTEHDPDEWVCAAPNPYLTGLGEKSVDNEAATFKPIARKDVWGYNDREDGTGTGLCDCYGMGRGNKGCSIISENKSLTEEKLSELPIACNFYRPYQMGFGIIDPSKKLRGDVDDDRITITDQGWARAKEWEDYTEYRLPLNYELYNYRAQFQKCHWWDEDTGREYLEDGSGFLYLNGDPEIFDEATGKVEFCKCTDTSAEPFNHRTLTSGSVGWETGSQFALDGVWARGGGPVCNGARPECPCYSGKWKYLISAKMLPGMPVTANQILELRFWSQEWDSQETYDEYFTQQPNFDDPETPAIYTFTKWKKPDSGDALSSKMRGKKLTLCQPAPLNKKEFSTEYIMSEELDYYHEEIGTSTVGDQRHFPTLVRNPSFPELKPLTIIYPYYNDEVFDAEPCIAKGDPGHVKRHNDIYGDSVKTVGQTTRNKQVYAINAEEIHIDWLLRFYAGVYAVRGTEIQERTAEEIKLNIYNILRETVARGIKEKPDYIKKATSDGIFGYFLIDSVKLKYNTNNRILICVDYGDGTWEYRWRQVINRWYGGVIKQLTYEHKYPSKTDIGYINTQPESITPTATATAQVKTIGYSARPFPAVDELTGLPTEDTIPQAVVYSVASLDNIARGITYYSYSIQEITEEESLEELWTTIGNTNKIWLEIKEPNINYVYDWDIESAELRIVMVEEEDALGVITEKPVREDVPEVVTLKKLLVHNNHIPPNACLLEPEEDIRIRFLSSEWELYVNYKYRKMTDKDVGRDGGAVEGANSHEMRKYYNPHVIEYDSGSEIITADEVSTSAMQIMAHFLDETGRVISTFATKLLANIIREGCRGVDIYYAYKAQGKKYQLNPPDGFCINIAADTPAGNFMHGLAPACGDHEYFPWKRPGPMWFPYNSCRGYDMYDEWTICNNCQTGYAGPINDGVLRDANGNIQRAGGVVIKRKDYRYCGPYKYHAFGKVRAVNAAAACNCGCNFSYSDASAATVVFAGYARKMTTVDVGLYRGYGWALPPFGNEGRELVEKFISQDYVNHPGGELTRNEWMPLMMDHSVFFSTFNAYDSNPEDEYIGSSEYYGLDPFRYVNQLNMGLSSAIREEIVPAELGRYRWEDIFEIHHEGNCSYPYPAYPLGGGNATKAVFYYFKSQIGELSEDFEIAWAWQEGWKDIERDIFSELPAAAEDEVVPEGEKAPIVEVGRLDFVDFIRPLYIFDFYKTEHRRITDEGPYIIHFKAPKLDDGGNVETYPTLSIDGNYPRSFNIFYDEDKYDGTRVTWRDEGGSSNTQGGSGEDNIYETAMGGDWVHDINTLFDIEASALIEGAESQDRKVVASVNPDSGITSYSYFNRGLIASMTRERLYYLPKQETILSYADSVFTDSEGDISVTAKHTDEYLYKSIFLIPGTLVWDSTSATIESTGDLVDGSDLPGMAFLKLRVRGSWGAVEGLNLLRRTAKYTLVRPGISLSYKFTDGTTGSPRSQSTMSTLAVTPAENQEVEQYEIFLEFLLGPIEMLKKKVSKFYINFTGEAGYFISVNEIDLYSAQYVDIKYEWINVWERKYIVSSFDDITGKGVNLDGNGDYLRYQSDGDNSGQYFSFRHSFQDEEITAIDKTKTVSCGIRYKTNESIDDVSYSTLHSVEKTEQGYLYEYAYRLDPSSDSINYTSVVPYKYQKFLDDLGIPFPVGDLIVISQKLPWSLHKLYKQFKQYEYWRPGGHFYRWADGFRREKCMLFGPARNVFDGYYAHVDHEGVGTPLESNASKPIDAINSYYSLRFYVQQAKYDRAMILSGGEPEFGDRVDGVVPFNVPLI